MVRMVDRGLKVGSNQRL